MIVHVRHTFPADMKYWDSLPELLSAILHLPSLFFYVKIHFLKECRWLSE